MSQVIAELAREETEREGGGEESHAEAAVLGTLVRPRSLPPNHWAPGPRVSADRSGCSLCSLRPRGENASTERRWLGRQLLVCFPGQGCRTPATSDTQIRGGKYRDGDHSERSTLCSGLSCCDISFSPPTATPREPGRLCSAFLGSGDCCSPRKTVTDFYWTL